MILSILFYIKNENITATITKFLKSQNNGWKFKLTNDFDTLIDTLKNEKINIIFFDKSENNKFDLALRNNLLKEHNDLLFIQLITLNPTQLIFKIDNIIHNFSILPLTSKTFRRKIENVYFLRDLVKNEKLYTTLNKIDKLPSLPELFIELERETQSENISLRKIANIISKDVSMTAKLLKVVNSAFMSIPFEVFDIHQAINYLGVEIIKSLVLIEKTFSSAEFSKIPSNLLHKLWDHSFKVAKTQKEISLLLSKSNSLAEKAYITGVLHDIGKLIIWNIFIKSQKSNNYEAFFEGLTVEKEFELFNSDHGQIGAFLLGLWGFSIEVIEAIFNHHHLEKQNFNQYSPAMSLYIANILSYENKLEEKKKLLELPLNDELKKFVEAIVAA